MTQFRSTDKPQNAPPPPIDTVSITASGRWEGGLGLTWLNGSLCGGAEMIALGILREGRGLPGEPAWDGRHKLRWESSASEGLLWLTFCPAFTHFKGGGGVHSPLTQQWRQVYKGEEEQDILFTLITVESIRECTLLPTPLYWVRRALIKLLWIKK